MHPDDELPYEPDFPTGKWTGYYQEGGCRLRQEMHLTFRETRLTGIGSDSIGEFTIRGFFDKETKEVWWTKHYVGAHDVFYRGYREIKGIWGVWEIGSYRAGFHIWPVEENELISAHVEEEVEEPVSAETE